MKKLILLVFFLVPYISHADIQSMRTKVSRILVQRGQAYGGCMMLSKWNIMEETGLNCTGKWISLGCNSNVISEEGAERMWQSARMAFFLEKDIIVWIDDEIKHSGHCTAVRLDVLLAGEQGE